ncbi:hypothetical protein HTG_19075 [Natrinema mahii]|nr:hypothetical protein HTG_19075 [Natrinema mahii]
MGAGNSEIVDAFEKFFEHYYDEEIKELAEKYPDEQRSLYVDWQYLHRFNADLADDFLRQPGQVRRFAEEGLRFYGHSMNVSLGQAHIRLYNLDERTDIGEIRSRHINQLVEITGTVDSISQSQSSLAEAAFECQLCGTLTRVPQGRGDEQEPHECQGCEQEGPFRVNEDQSEFVDTQTLYLEQRPAGVGTDDDREIIVVELRDDLVDEVVPGNTINVSGIVRRDEELKDSKASVPDKYIDAIGISEAQEYQLNIRDEDKEQIVRLASDDDIYEKMVESIAPTIYGCDQEKLAMLLQLFSGVTKQLPDETRIRGDIHIGLLGDPGVGKSQLARYAARVAPRAVHVSATNTTEVGLTAAAKRTSSSNSTWTFEAGALPKADQGIACVDNITDFREEELRTLHDVLEEQVVEASKGSSTVSIPARASLLAVGNPKYGRFDQYEPLGGQLALEPGLLSQFDLLFLITDQPDEREDKKLADHVLQANYAGELSRQESEYISPEVESEEVEKEIEQVSPVVDPDLLQKYAAYARSNCYPRMTDEAREAIKEFYVDIRSSIDEDQSVPVSARKLEALVRLSEASARIRLSDTIEESDAERVIELVRSCLRDIGIDPETGEFDADIVEAGTSKSNRDRIKNLKHLIEDIEEEYDDGAPTELVLDRASEVGMDQSKAEHEIDKLKQKGKVYEPSTDRLRAVPEKD